MDLSEFKGKRVAVAMSGGVDSAVAALLLKQAGAIVTGITMRLTPDSKCCSLADIAEAIRVAGQIGIPHSVTNLRELFEEKVIDYFADESWKGRTPNPCVPCNTDIKFGSLMQFCLENSDFYATGHYARKEYDKRKKRWLLRRAIDPKKDQSYVLSMLTQEQLARVVFPLGDRDKQEIKKIAQENKLFAHERKESQDLCFLHEEKGDFIEKWSGRKSGRGKVYDTQGRELGEHDGYIRHPLGQRKGLGLTAPKPLYIKEVDLGRNALIVGTRSEASRKEFQVCGINWVAFAALEKPMAVEVVVRNKQSPHKAQIFPEGKNNVKVVAAEPIFAVSPGQLAVFFKKDLILGGGWIE